MDPRYQPEMKKSGRFVRGRMIGVPFYIGADGIAEAYRPCAIEVNRDGHYLNGRGPGFELDGLEIYDGATGLLYTTERDVVHGVLTIGMVRQNETPEDAFERLVPAAIPDVPALWAQLQANEADLQAKLHDAVRGGGGKLLEGLGVDPDDVSFEDGSHGFRRP